MVFFCICSCFAYDNCLQRCDGDGDDDDDCLMPGVALDLALLSADVEKHLKYGRKVGIFQAFDLNTFQGRQIFFFFCETEKQ